MCYTHRPISGSVWPCRKASDIESFTLAARKAIRNPKTQQEKISTIASVGPKHPAASDVKPCPVCGEEIKVSARKCIHCSSELTWRKYLTFSSTTLALLTALVSVIATGA